jgi:hypothetical protein
VKYQLYTFDGYFEISNENSFSLIFLKPVLFKGDLLFLARRHPTMIEAFDHGARWLYSFQKQLHSGENEKGYFDLPIDLVFQNNKLIVVKFPVRFIEILPKPFIIAGLRALGRTQINVRGRFASGSFYEKNTQSEIRIPKKQDLIRLLGKPSVEEKTGGLLKLTYRYRLEPNKLDSNKRPAVGWARLTFRSGSDDLLKAEARFSIIRLSLDFENRPGSEHAATERL